MPTPSSPSTPELPFPISRISNKVERYFLYSAPTITWLRREHHILGVLIGTLAQIPQQNVFLGIPLELQPEEARLLVEKGLAYIVDDQEWHRTSYSSMSGEEKAAYREQLRQEGQRRASADAEAHRKRSEQALKRRQQNPPVTGSADLVSLATLSQGEQVRVDEEEETLFSTPPPTSLSLSPTTKIPPYLITPSTSHALIPSPPPTTPQPLPTVNPSSYALYAHLHSKNYFLSPGLRFGCQFLVYPGDPLRFHSHFLAVGKEWDQEIDLLDLVGGGRLGTGVKKGYMIGGPEEGKSEREASVRTFCIEWGGM